ncbi:hypothetical protein EDB84DRAFT_1435400 [Lactarius hengduanensis]|nr:hypothetical protein EDB84DRAFT_1435400 [Lactarius hengduanensis]
MTYDPTRNIPDLTGKIIIITGAKHSESFTCPVYTVPPVGFLVSYRPRHTLGRLPHSKAALCVPEEPNSPIAVERSLGQGRLLKFIEFIFRKVTAATRWRVYLRVYVNETGRINVPVLFSTELERRENALRGKTNLYSSSLWHQLEKRRVAVVETICMASNTKGSMSVWMAFWSRKAADKRIHAYPSLCLQDRDVISFERVVRRIGTGRCAKTREKYLCPIMRRECQPRGSPPADTTIVLTTESAREGHTARRAKKKSQSAVRAEVRLCVARIQSQCEWSLSVREQDEDREIGDGGPSALEGSVLVTLAMRPA